MLSIATLRVLVHVLALCELCQGWPVSESALRHALHVKICPAYHLQIWCIAQQP